MFQSRYMWRGRLPRPVRRDDMYDHLDPASAVVEAWRNPVTDEHYGRQDLIRRYWPELARALDRAVYGDRNVIRMRSR